MSTILVVGVTGNLGKYFVPAAKGLGLKLKVLLRASALEDPKKRELVEGCDVCVGDLSDKESLLNACKGVDVVLSFMKGDGQLSLIRAAKESGVKRFVPSDFSCCLVDDKSPCTLAYAVKKQARDLLQEIGLEWTSIQSNGFLEWFGPGCFNMLAKPFPAKVEVYDGGNTKLTMTKLHDIATLTLMLAQDPRAANQYVNIAFPSNVLTQNEMIDLWESISNTSVERVPVSAEEIAARMEAAYKDEARQLEAITMHVVTGYVVAKLSTGEPRDGVLMAHDLFPDYKPTTVREFYEELAAKGKHE